MNIRILTIATLLLTVGILCFRLRAVDEELKDSAVDPVYGIGTRQGLNRRWRRHGRRLAVAREIVFFDLDDMREANNRWEYAEVGQRIKAALLLRDTDDFISIDRWYSGDEILALVAEGDADGTTQSLQARLAEQGLSATFGIASVLVDLKAAVNIAADEVHAAPACGLRGSINP